MRSRQGQSTVEVVALLPVLAVAGLALLQLLAAGAAAEYAGHAAEAGAVAILQGRDPAAAARASLPSWSARRVEIRVSGDRVEVRLQPPALMARVGALLTATARANAGPPPS
ncbi:MAG: hypothetical protein ACJ76S_00680 [Solirubrobacteraceae bacterium]